jgi:phage gpG-like protein
VSPLDLGIQAQGDDVASRHLTELAKRGEDPRPAFRQIVEEMRSAEGEWFGSDGAGTWPKLADSTLEAKRRAGFPTDVLVATGALRRSLTVKRGKGAQRSITKRQMRFGTKVYYGKFHDQGSGVAKRPILVPMDAKARRRMVADVRDHMLGKTRGPSA